MFASTRSNGAAAAIAARRSRWRDRPHQMSRYIQPGVFAGDLHRGRIDIARQYFLVQRLGGGNRQHAGAGAEIEYAAGAASFQDVIEQQQAAARGAVVAGAERQRRLDFDADLVGRNPFAVMLPVHDEASGRDRDEVLEAGPDPSLASTVSKSIVLAMSALAALVTSSRTSAWSGGSAKCTVTSQRPSARTLRSPPGPQRKLRLANRQRAGRLVRHRWQSWHGGWGRWKSLKTRKKLGVAGRDAPFDANLSKFHAAIS